MTSFKVSQKISSLHNLATQSQYCFASLVPLKRAKLGTLVQNKGAKTGIIHIFTDSFRMTAMKKQRSLRPDEQTQ